MNFSKIQEEKKQETEIQNDTLSNMNSVNQGEQLSQELNESFQNTQLADLSKFVEKVFDPTINLKEQYNQIKMNSSTQSSNGCKSEYRVVTFYYVDEYKKFKTLKDLHQHNDQNAKDISIKSISKDDCIIHYFLLIQS
ncbi:hypothetical protein ABPG72_019091 [Tetrahymena utriculariae]